MLYLIPERLKDRTPYANLPAGNGVVFTMPFSDWLVEHAPVGIVPINNELYVEIDNAVTLMSFQYL